MVARKSLIRLTVVSLWIGFGSQGVADPVVYPKPMLDNRSAGLIEAKVAGDWYRGSGVVARDPRLIYSCAHMFYGEGVWATRMVFHRAWHDRRFPRTSQGAEPRGLIVLTSYADLVDSRGAESNRAFAADFTILYRNRSFGPAVPVAGNGGAAVRSPRSKRIVGYPGEVDFTRRRGFTLQHSTGPFSQRAERFFGPYHEFRGVSTGPGNSGGPVFVRNRNGEEVLAGVLVSGWRRMAGVRAIDRLSESMATQALGPQTKTLKFANRNRIELAPGDESWTERKVLVEGVGGTTRTLSFSMAADAPGGGSSFDAWLRSPDGTVRWIRRAGRGAGAASELQELDLTDRFGGADPNGVWTLHLRAAPDAAPMVFGSFSLTLSSS